MDNGTTGLITGVNSPAANASSTDSSSVVSAASVSGDVVIRAAAAAIDAAMPMYSVFVFICRSVIIA